MLSYDLSLADAAVIDSQYPTQRLFRDMLIRLGLKTVTTYGSFQEAATLLAAATPDLVLIDADGEDGEAFRFVRSLRNEPGTPNPYTCLIATTWQPTPTLLLRVTNSGVDDLMVKPVSPKQVQDRIVTLIENRKSFVVTADFTGPDRRKSPREGAAVPLIDVPNTLRLKATGKWTAAGLRLAMQQANVRVNEQKRLRASIQAAFLVEFAATGLTGGQPDRMALEHLSRVPVIVDELLRRLPEGNDGTSAVANACRSLKDGVERLRSIADSGSFAGAGEEVSRVRAVAQALMEAVDPARAPEALTAEVATAVAGYRSRLEQMARAKLAESARAAAPEAAGPAV
ncbi:response regulator [Azospirillum halopraeferens]|uniref:response regulator n=1 Tax=Azospirillum halopraeferens TaxID=34010 RepID=UPI0004915EB3|nr:response regulator [Azospirillum halopraeferens]